MGYALAMLVACITLYIQIGFSLCSRHIFLIYIVDGKFAAYMQVALENDGPVTIQLDSRKE